MISSEKYFPLDVGSTHLHRELPDKTIRHTFPAINQISIVCQHPNARDAIIRGVDEIFGKQISHLDISTWSLPQDPPANVRFTINACLICCL